MSSGPIFQSLRRLTCFAAIADAGSIKGGAKRLGLSVSVVSTALAELEEELSVRLAVRSTRKLELTEAGSEVYEHAQAMLASADKALVVATNDRVTRGELRITIPIELSSYWLPAYLHQFYAMFPGIRLSIDAEDAVVVLHSSEYDIAIQAIYKAPHLDGDSKLKRPAIALGKINLVCVSATKPRVRWQENTAIMNTPLLEIKERGDHLIATDTKNSRTIKLRGSQLIRTNNHETALAMARQGLGAVLVMEESAREDLATRRMVRVLPSYHFGHLDLELKVRDSLPSPATRAFVNYMQTQIPGN